MCALHWLLRKHVTPRQRVGVAPCSVKVVCCLPTSVLALHSLVHSFPFLFASSAGREERAGGEKRRGDGGVRLDEV